MVLLVDVGNSRIKAAEYVDRVLGPTTAIERPQVLDEGVLDRLWSRGAAPDRVLIANVTGTETEAVLCDGIQARWAVVPEVIRVKADAYGVRNAYARPATFGVDRWVALIYARHRLPLPACIIDLGSAITVDVLDPAGGHLGGLIIPGIEMMRHVLADRIPGLELNTDLSESSASLLATDTRGAVYGGTLYAAVALVDRIIEDIADSVGGEIHGVLAGGDAVGIKALIRTPCRLEPDIVLKGLAVIVDLGG